MILKFAILATNTQPWNVMHRVSKETWAKDSTDVLFLFGGAPKTELRGQDLHVPAPDASCLEKSLDAFEYMTVRKYSADYICRGCDGSYFDIPRLTSLLEHRSRTCFYGGPKICYSGIEYASGSGYILSRDCAVMAVERRRELLDIARQFGELSHVSRMLEDVVMGAFFARYCIPCYNTMAGYEDTNFENKEAYHYHFRTNPDLMRAIHAMKTAEGKS